MDASLMLMSTNYKLDLTEVTRRFCLVIHFKGEKNGR